MTSARRLQFALAAMAVTAAACAAPGTNAAPRPEPTTGPELTSLPPATTSRESTTASTSAPPSSAPPPPTLPAGPAIPAGQTVCDLYDSEIAELGVVASEAVVEASGIAASRVNDSTYWVINDSGNDPVLHAVSATGATLASLPVPGVLAFDWEDIAVGPGPIAGVSYVYIGDIGDNLRLRSTISLLRFPEPDLSIPEPMISEVTTVRLSYPESAEDAEALWVDPLTGAVFVVTKRQDDGRSVALRAPAPPADPREPISMEPVAEFVFGQKGQVTGADVTADGAVVALRGYNEVWMWVRIDLDYDRTLAAEPCLAPSPEEVQGEALAFVAGELSYVTLSEGPGKPLNLVSAQLP